MALYPATSTNLPVGAKVRLWDAPEVYITRHVPWQKRDSNDEMQWYVDVHTPIGTTTTWNLNKLFVIEDAPDPSMPPMRMWFAVTRHGHLVPATGESHADVLAEGYGGYVARYDLHQPSLPHGHALFAPNGLSNEDCAPALSKRECESTKSEAPKMYPVIVQQWIESERGWGHRPDGVSLHLTETDRVAFCKEYWANEKKNNTSGQTPDTYSREDGPPMVKEVDEKMYKKIVASKNGIRL